VSTNFTTWAYNLMGFIFLSQRSSMPECACLLLTSFQPVPPMRC